MRTLSPRTLSRTVAVAVVTAFLFVAAQVPEASAQDRPDFSGSWTLSETAGGPGGGAAARGPGGGMRGGMGMMAGIGQEATISQEAGHLVIVRTTPRGEVRTTYNLDGSESRNSMGMGDRQIELVSTTSWDEGKLVIVTPMTMGDRSGETRMTLSLDEAGNLVVETARSGGMGGGMGGGMEGRTMRAVYSKK